MQRGRESEHQGGREREQHGEQKRRRLGLKPVDDLRHQYIRDLDGRDVEREPEQRSGHRVDQRLRQHLANEPQACCAEREPHADLAPPGGGAAEQEGADVRARDHDDEGRDEEEGGNQLGPVRGSVGDAGETLGADRQSCVRGRLFLREASGQHGRLAIDVRGSHARARAGRRSERSWRRASSTRSSAARASRARQVEARRSLARD